MVGFDPWIALALALQAPPIHVEWKMGDRLAEDLESRDGRVDDHAIAVYLAQIQSRLAAAAGARQIEVRLTRGLDQYARLLPNRVLYLSAGLMERLQNEAELAGLIAHQLAHAEQGAWQTFGACVLTSEMVPIRWAESMRDKESQANRTAINSLRTAGYDASGALDVLSKLVYEHPTWAFGIEVDDLLRLRAEVEAQDMPPEGYTMDTSGFPDTQARLAVLLGHPLRKQPSLLRR